MSIPVFPVTLDGVPIVQEHNTYPLITFKDITYFPLTWSATRALGLAYSWDDQNGLSIVPGYEQGIPGKIKWSQDNSATNRPGTQYTASLVSFPVSVYGQMIDNASEPFPLLQFRDITYFPMTWHFAHDLFHMNLEWKEPDGLTITKEQNRIFDRIEYDDENYLYIRNYMYKHDAPGYLKIAKSLKEPPQWIRAETVGKLFEKQTQSLWGFDGEAELKQKEDVLYFQDARLTSIKKYLDENKELFEAYPNAVNNGVSYHGMTHKLSGKLTLLWLEISVDIPVKDRFHGSNGYSMCYLIHDGTATELPFSMIQRSWDNADGSHWVVGNRWNLLLITPGGEIRTVNDLFQGSEIEVPHFGYPRTEEGTLIIKVHSPVSSTFSLNTKLNFSKLYGSEIEGQASYSSYVEGYRNDLYQVSVNKVTNVTKNESRTYWDYELYEASDTEK
ncbi:hypothetical protein [Paenibacillus sp. OAS669]|uniref:hypothetical protein n=1 Tax=Paenibacillus sp. OAS669 TaxID=2663821 RepID=UPI0017891059|nr:hypothetical protein [Paenibacillus sp. OAS669]MBE1441659.1 hypothetical protein [Paenibacillus sp. OAS669]